MTGGGVVYVVITGGSFDCSRYMVTAAAMAVVLAVADPYVKFFNFFVFVFLPLVKT